MKPTLLLLCSTLAGLAGDDAGFQPLFPTDGVPAGWVVRHWADVGNPAGGTPKWEVKDGTLTGAGDRGCWLLSEKEYGDLVLEYEFRLGPRGNSGLALRAPAKGDPAFDGLELQMADLRYNPEALPSELTGDQTQVSGIVLEGHIRDVPVQDALITRCSHLVFGGQVDPQLDHFQGAATAGECLGMELFMQDSGRRRHPLHITGADHTAVTGGIAVFDFALVNDGDGFKPAMRVLPYAATLGSRREFGGSCVIQQQERADVFTHLVVRKHRAYRETITDPVATRRCVNAKTVFHRVPPVIHGNSLDSMRFVD